MRSMVPNTEWFGKGFWQGILHLTRYDGWIDARALNVIVRCDEVGAAREGCSSALGLSHDQLEKKKLLQSLDGDFRAQTDAVNQQGHRARRLFDGQNELPLLRRYRHDGQTIATPH